MLEKLSRQLSTILLIAILLFLAGRYFYMLPKFDPGEQAPDFAIGLDASGDSLYLSELEGKKVLLDFWGSWCPPCRKENPELLALYREFHEKPPGFEIVSVGIERNPDAWKRAIEKDRLEWPYHLLDKTGSLRFFNGPIASQYGVKQLPSKYFIDERGKIIAVDPSAKELRKLLSGK